MGSSLQPPISPTNLPLFPSSHHHNSTTPPQHPSLAPLPPLQPIILNIEIQSPHPGFRALVASYRAEAAVLARAGEGTGLVGLSFCLCWAHSFFSETRNFILLYGEGGDNEVAVAVRGEKRRGRKRRREGEGQNLLGPHISLHTSAYQYKSSS